MASFIYTGFVDKLFSASVNLEGDVFKVLLVTSAYKPNRYRHASTADVMGEASGFGYLPGGTVVRVERTVNQAGLFDITLGEAEWRDASITARGAIYYRTGTLMTAVDVLIAFIDFGRDIIATNGTFDLRPSTMKIGN